MSFQTTLRIRIGDVNYGGHLGHDRLITLLHQARLEFLRTLNASESNFFGVGLILRRLECDYLAEAFCGEDLTIAINVSGVRGSAFTLHYQVTRGVTIIARAITQMVTFDYQQRRPRPLPSAFVTLIGTSPS